MFKGRLTRAAGIGPGPQFVVLVRRLGGGRTVGKDQFLLRTSGETNVIGAGEESGVVPRTGIKRSRSATALHGGAHRSMASGRGGGATLPGLSVVPPGGIVFVAITRHWRVWLVSEVASATAGGGGHPGGADEGLRGGKGDDKISG